MRVNRTLITMIVAMVAMIGMTGIIGAATYDSSVTLDNKDAGNSYDPTPNDGISAVVDFNCTGSEFEWSAIGTAKIANIEYSLIYYADPWPGNNPGALIGTFDADSTGAFDKNGSKELNMNLPSPPDANINPIPDYCDEHNGIDNYTNCCGAKLWIIPSSDYDGIACKLTSWTPDNYLFEEDLITYEDCDEYYNMQAVPENATFMIGDVFNYSVASVPIMVLNATNVGAVQVTLEYDASVLNFESVSKGDMDNMGQPNNGIDNGTGWVRMITYQGSNPGMNGDFNLANVSFTKAGEGTCDFVITVTTYKDGTPCGRSMPYLMDIGICCPNDNGDVNGDGVVDAFDVMYLAKHLVGITGFDNICECAADVSGDGTIDAFDVMYLEKHLVGIPGFEELR